MSTPETPEEVTVAALPLVEEGWREIDLSEGNGMLPYLDPFLPPASVQEGRRAYALSLLVDSNHVLSPQWATEVAKLVAFLESGTLPPAAAPRPRIVGGGA